MSREKYRYLEEFIDPKTGFPIEGGVSPKFVNTKHFGRRLLHQIAKCEYVDTEDENGNKSVSVEIGEKGGWIERKSNLSQKGDSWIEEGAIACGTSTVRGNAVLKDEAEIGDSAMVSDSAVVQDTAWIKEHGSASDKAVLKDESRIEGSGTVKCMVAGKSVIKENARVLCDRNEPEEGRTSESPSIKDSEIGGMAYLSGDVRVYGAKVTGNSKIVSFARIGEGAVIKGESFIAGEIAGEIELDSCILCTPRAYDDDRLPEVPYDIDKVKRLETDIENLDGMEGAVCSSFSYNGRTGTNLTMY